MTRGAKVFQVGYHEVSRTMEKTKEAGAAIRAELKTGRTAEERGTMTVVRPLGGGQVERLMDWLMVMHLKSDLVATG